MQNYGRSSTLSSTMGPKEMKFRFDCKMQQVDEELEFLRELFRDEVQRLDDKFVLVEDQVEKMNAEQKEQLFNLKTE